MMETQFADLTTGYERFDALVKNLEGIFAKVYEMKEYKLDISYYEEKLEEFKKEFKIQDKYLKDTKMLFAHLQKDLEYFALNDCNKKLQKLTEEFESNITPIYNIYLLFNYIDRSLENKDNNIQNIINKTIELINQINITNTHNKIDIKNLIEGAYRTIYEVLLYEEAFNKQDVLNYLKRKNLSSNRENLGKILREDIKNLSITKDQIDEEFIKHIEEGLGYDYLSSEFLKIISRIKLEKKHQEVEEKKERAMLSLKKAIDDFNSSEENLNTRIKDDKSSIRNLRVNKLAVGSKAALLVLIPIMTISGGHLLGKTLSNRITEYATTTRVVDVNKGTIIGEPTTVYDEHVTTYVATVTIYEPWKKNTTGVGYIRNAIAYEYIVPEGAGEDYHISKEDIEGHVREKYRFIEPKDTLSSEDSMTDTVIYVTETYQDKTNTQKSTKYVLPFTIGGGVLGAGADFALIFFNIINLYRIKRKMKMITEEIRTNKWDILAAKRELENLQQELLRIKDENNKLQGMYGIMVDISSLDNQKKKHI